ncbi:MAG: HAD family hydrolase [Bacillota bacterium]
MTAEKYKKEEIEIIKDEVRRGKFKSALFDFDGTISLIRRGWQEVMESYFTEVLQQVAINESEKEIRDCAREFIDKLTGKQTIYQCIRLAEEVEKRGGEPEEPLEYKHEYYRRLMNKIDSRLEGLKKGSIEPEELRVPGSRKFLEYLYNRGINLYLASGTDEDYVLKEAELLEITEFFDGEIYGAKDDYENFSKADVIKEIINTHNLEGFELIGFGDGFVEIENVKEVGGFAAGVASDEEKQEGIDEWKRERLIEAGADIIIPDFRNTENLKRYLFGEE